MTVHNPSRIAANRATDSVLNRAITTRPSLVWMMFDCAMMLSLHACTVPMLAVAARRLVFRGIMRMFVGVFRCMFRGAPNRMVVFSAHHDESTNRVPERYDTRVIVAALQSIQNAMFQGESSLSMGMTFVSWFQECCSSCWILHDANVAVSLSRRNAPE